MLTDDAAHELTYFVGLEWGDDDRRLLAPLIDAAIVWAEPDQLAAVSAPIVETLWTDGLREDIERALDDAAGHYKEVERALAAAKADLASGPHGSLLARAIVEQGGFDLAGVELMPGHCLLCLEEGLSRTRPEERRTLVLRIAQGAGRILNVPAPEVRAALAASALGGPDTAVALATDMRRQMVRDWLGRLAELGRLSIPRVAEELKAALCDPDAGPAADPVWREAVVGLTAALAAQRN